MSKTNGHTVRRYTGHKMSLAEKAARKAARREEDAADRSERAMQAGMAFGCDGYNDEMGW